MELLTAVDDQRRALEKGVIGDERSHVVTAVVVDDPSPDAIVLLEYRLERDHMASCQVRSGSEQTFTLPTVEMMEKIDHQHDVESLSLSEVRHIF